MTYYPIREDLARRSKEMMSFSDYKAGSATAEYRHMVDAAAEIAEKQKARTDPMYHDKIDALLDKYARRLAENFNRDYEIGTRCPSVMIAGPANFPTRKKEKQVAAWERNQRDYQEVQEILRQIGSVGMGGISSDDPQALEKLRAKLSKLEKHQETMKAANAAIRMKDTAKGNAKLAELGYTPEEIAQLRTPDFCGRIGYPSYELSNNNANIHRIRDRIKELEKRAAQPSTGTLKFDGGEIVRNTELNRLQILFDDIPSEAARNALKGEGFKWSPKNQAWQRQLTPNAERAARRALNITGDFAPATDEPQEAQEDKPENIQETAAVEPQQPEQPQQPEDETEEAQPPADIPGQVRLF